MSDTTEHVVVEHVVKHVVTEQRAKVLLCRLNRPEKKNALTHAMYTAMGDALARLEADPSVRVLVFTGTDDSFTAGNDLGDFLGVAPVIDGLTPVGRFLHLISTATKPVVAAVNGLAVGVGVTMLLHCDLAYAAPAARFKMPFVDLGLVPEAGSSLLLPQLVGHRRASELLLLSEMFDAQAALRMGFVNALADDAIGYALEQAHVLAAKSPSAVRHTKRLLRSPLESITGRMAEEGAIFAALLQSPEFKEAATAFAERRPADFSAFE
jgi:enoyl-CoA hydratase/carnithine racemase